MIAGAGVHHPVRCLAEKNKYTLEFPFALVAHTYIQTTRQILFFTTYNTSHITWSPLANTHPLN